MSDLTLVLVPGLWEGTAVFDPLRASLAKHGITNVHTAGLKSTGTTPPNNPNMQDDIDGIRAVIEPLVKAGKKVVVVAHSAGGFLASAATDKLEVGHTEGPGGVVQFFYIAAGLFPVGTPHGSLPFMDFQGDKMFCKDADQLLFNDVPADVKAKYQPLMLHQPSSNWDGTVPYAGWEKVPSTYLVADNDNCLPPDKQEYMASSAKCTIVHAPLGHLAMLSGPDVVAEQLAAAIKA